MLIIQVQSREIETNLQALGKKLGRPRVVMQAAVRGARRVLQRHLAEKDQTPNKLGGKRTHFWSEVRSSVQIGEVTDTTGRIEIGDARFAQKVFGGKITAKTPWKNGLKLLTIPVDPRAHGRRAETFKRETGLKLVFFGNASGGVLGVMAKDQGLQVIYAATPEVNQEKDPTALPPVEAMEEAAMEAAESTVGALTQGNP